MSDSVSVNIERPVVFSEADWQRYVISLARLFGWRVAHLNITGDASDKGVPDLILVRDNRLIFAELKRYSNTPVPDEQAMWLEELACVPGVRSFLWSPDSWEDVVEHLSGGVLEIAAARSAS